MRIIAVEKLDGVNNGYLPTLLSAMEACSNGQRLAVCLYFMSDLPDARHHLADVEHNLRRMFPPSIGYHYTADQYDDFQASAIRGLFNRETQLVRHGQLRTEERLWVNTARGHWRNTPLGNQIARQVLRDKAVLVQRRDLVLNAADELVPEVKRPYMEEE